MKSDRKDIKLKIDELDKEIKFLENKINEISWQRTKYQEFYKKSIIAKADHWFRSESLVLIGSSEYIQKQNN